MKLRIFKFLGITMGSYLLLSALEIFVLGPLLDVFGESFWIRLLVYNILLLLINPLAVWLFVNRFDYRADIKERDVL